MLHVIYHDTQGFLDNEIVVFLNTGFSLVVFNKTEDYHTLAAAVLGYMFH